MALGARFSGVLESARMGEEWAFTVLYRDLHPRLLRYLRTVEPAEAEDLASDTWMGVATGLDRFEGGEDDFRRWLFTIARRRHLDLARRRRRRRTDPVPTSDLAGMGSRGDVEMEAMANLTADAATSRIAAVLPPDQAEVLLLRVLGDLSVKQVAAVVGKRPGAVRALQHRALSRLSRELSPEPVTR